jgi:hypothetical protein
MEVVDRHGWVEGMTIKSFGKHIGFRSDEPGVVKQLLDLFPPGWERSDEVAVRRLYSLRMGGQRGRRKRYNVLYMNAKRFERSLDFQWILDRLEADMRLYVAERAVRRTFVHAGVVAYNGKALVLPGSSMTGKTTLVQELLGLGATYYSDEYAVLSDSGRVYPFAKPLSVRGDDLSVRAVKVDPAELGFATGEAPIPVGLVALTGFNPGGTFRPRRLSRGKAILAMLQNTVPARRRPRSALRTLEKVVSVAPVLKGRRGDARVAAESLLRRLG